MRKKIIKHIILFPLVFVTLSTTNKSVNLKTCQVKTFDKIYHMKHHYVSNYKDLIKQSNCSEEVQKKFTDIVLNFDGPLRAKYLKTAFKNDFLPYKTVEISPPKIFVSTVDSLLSKELGIQKNLSWRNITLNNRKEIFLLNKNESISFSCSNCNTTGTKTISAKLNSNKSKGKNKFWFQGELVSKTKALISKINMPVTNKRLSSSDFKLETVEALKPEEYFTDIQSINYFKLNKSIRVGMPLKNSYLHPVNLVTLGAPTKIILKNNTLTLTGTAIAGKTAKFGEIINLKRSPDSREIFGKVVGFNKVLIEL